MIRTLLAAPLGLGLALALFYALALVTRVEERSDNDILAIPDLNFQLVRQESDIRRRQRQTPPEPPEPVTQQQPRMPALEAPSAPPVDVSTPSIEVPEISMGVQLQLSPSLHDLARPEPVMTVDANPTILSQIPPSYPRSALRRRQQGHVLVEFTIGTTGTIEPGSIKVLESTPPGVFDRVVLSAIQRWRFKTRQINGQAVPFKARQKLEFKLEN